MDYKRTTLMGCMRRVHEMASNNQQLLKSGVAKLAEFRALGYPESIRTYVCAIMGRETRNTTWFRVRDTQYGNT